LPTNHLAVNQVEDWSTRKLANSQIANVFKMMEPAHLVAHQRTKHSIVVRPTAVHAISTDIISQAIVKHCRTSDLELTATCCVKLQLSLYFQIQT